MWPIHMRSVGREPQRPPAQNAVEWAFLRSGAPSRSGARVMGLDGLTGEYTGQSKTQTARRPVSMATDGTSCPGKVTGQDVQRMIAPLWTVGLYAQMRQQAGAVDDRMVTPCGTYGETDHEPHTRNTHNLRQ